VGAIRFLNSGCSPPTMLIARDLVIEAGIRVLLEDASFSVQAGDKIGLVGRNGAGKTTLMKTLHGDLEPASGVILRSGRIGYFSREAAVRDLAHPSDTALAKTHMAGESGAMKPRLEHAGARLEHLDGAERHR